MFCLGVRSVRVYDRRGHFPLSCISHGQILTQQTERSVWQKFVHLWGLFGVLQKGTEQLRSVSGLSVCQSVTYRRFICDGFVCWIDFAQASWGRCGDEKWTVSASFQLETFLREDITFISNERQWLLCFLDT